RWLWLLSLPSPTTSTRVSSSSSRPVSPPASRCSSRRLPTVISLRWTCSGRWRGAWPVSTRPGSCVSPGASSPCGAAGPGAGSALGYVLALVVGGAVVARLGWRAALFVLALGPVLCFALSLVLFHGARAPRPRAPAPARRMFDTDLSGNRPAQLMIWGYVFHSWELLGRSAEH